MATSVLPVAEDDETDALLLKRTLRRAASESTSDAGRLEAIAASLHGVHYNLGSDPALI